MNYQNSILKKQPDTNLPWNMQISMDKFDYNNKDTEVLSTSVIFKVQAQVELSTFF